MTSVTTGTSDLGAGVTMMMGQHMCQICGRLFTERNNVLRHMQIHTGVKPYNCSLCPYQSNRNGNLIRHMKYRHGKNIENVN